LSQGIARVQNNPVVLGVRLRTFQRLHKIRYEENNASTYLSIIDYWTMLNQGGRFLVDGGTSQDNNVQHQQRQQQQQISLNFWPNGQR
jgi:hypothetical protein